MHSESFIESLLFEPEGTELDFKQAQYKFEGADDRAKSELLKDILAFANAWRRTDAFILIGVQEVGEAEAMVVGIEEHIDDAKLQQFVNSKTNRPVDFSYTPTAFKSKQIGVINIPVQERPTYLTKDFGALHRNTVYLRRGSSTAEARPDEIARMGLARREGLILGPVLRPQLAAGTDWSKYVDTISFETVNLKNLDVGSLPDYSPPAPSSPFGVLGYALHQHINSAFYRDRAAHLRFIAKLRSIRFAVTNQGTGLATGVKCKIQLNDPANAIEIALQSHRPREPQRELSVFTNMLPALHNLHARDIELTKTNTGWTIIVTFGKIQAKDTACTESTLYIGVSSSEMVVLPVAVFADELSNPVLTELSIAFAVTEKEIAIENLTC